MKPKILATSWHPGGMNAIIPVIKKLGQEGIVDVVTIGYQHSENILNNHGIKYNKISDYGLENVSVESMAKVLEQESPNLILTGTSSQDENNKDVIEQTITMAGRKKAIKTLSVLDFWGNYSLRFKDTYSGEQFKFLPNKIAIMDQYAERDMLSEGFKKENLIITGNPHFDNLEAKAKEFTENQKNSLKEKIGIHSKVTFFYAANTWKKQEPQFGYWDLDNIKLINEVLIELSKKEENKYGLVVKLHPLAPEEDVNMIKGYIQAESQEHIKLVSGIHPHELILASNLTLTPSSTVGIEAVYMGKPVISIQPNLRCEDFLAILTKNNIVPVGYTNGDCKSLVKKAFVNDTYREEELINRASSFRTDGKATERVTGLVYDLMKK